MSEGYEEKDAHAGPLAIAGVVLGVITLLVCLSLIGFYFYLDHQSLNSDKGSFFLLDKSTPHISPQLQTVPKHDLAVHRQTAAEELHQYAWADPVAETIRIPIEEAMAQVVSTVESKVRT